LPPVVEEEQDRQVRVAAFDFLARQTAVSGRVLSRSTLSAGFLFDGQRVPLIGPRGIFKPAVIGSGIPLSFTTAPEVERKSRPYENEVSPDGFLRYGYRGTDAGHRENVGLRTAMVEQVPLIYFHDVAPASMCASGPCSW
jgi:putative restriction endonuclease